MTKKDLENKQKSLLDELSQIEKELYKYNNSVCMVSNIKGKITFQIHPVNQINNLIANGWKKANDEDIENLKKYR